MKKLKQFLPEMLFFALLALWTFLLGCMIRREELSYGWQIATFLLFLADSAVMIPLLRRLHRKWKAKTDAALKRFFASASLLIMRLAEKLEKYTRIFRRKKNTVYGKTSYSFDFSTPEKQKKKPPKPPKWKQMETARQKLGYLYYHLITARIKGGMHAKSTDTPLDLKHRQPNLPDEERVFDLYLDARYDERAELEEQELDGLKATLFGRKK